MKNKQKPLSPENYMRTRARTLPLRECYINDDWRETGFAMIIIAREHINGNITHGSFLVDLYCLGLKDSFWKFNEHPIDFKEFMNKQYEKTELGLNLIEINYPLVHNIIYGAIEFAGELGFSLHKSFEITRYLLEEDDERVKMIDIEFGYKGKPLYVSPHDTPAENRRVLSHLEKKVGKGNFHFITEAEADNFFEQEAEEDYETDNTDYDDPAIKKALIDELLLLAKTPSKLLSGKPEKIAEAVEKAETIFFKYMVTAEDEKTAIGHIQELFDFTVSNEIFSYEMIFGKSPFTGNREKIIKEAEQLFIMASDGQADKGMPRVEKLIRQYPDLPIFRYLHLRFLEIKSGTSKLKADYKAHVEMFPDYLPFEYLYLNASFIQMDKDFPLIFPEHLHLKNFYPERSVFSIEESQIDIHIMIVYYGMTGEVLKLLLMLINFEARFPNILPDSEFFSGRLMMLPKVLMWCESQR